MKTLITLVAALLIPLTATAAEGWQKINWGMTQEEAKKAWPELQPFEAGAGMDLPLGRRYVHLTLPDYAIGDLRFIFYLMFDEKGKACGVMLENLRPPLRNDRQYDADYEKLVTLLTRKYGDYRFFQQRDLGFEEFMWLSGNVLINASHQRNKEGGSFMRIIYQGVDPETLGKLEEQLKQIRPLYPEDDERL